MKKIWNWLVLSSVDASQWSMTVKGALLAVIPVVSVILGLAHIIVGQQDLTNLVDAFVSVLQAVLAVISAVVFLYGLVRKLWSTYRGTNAVLNQP